MRTFTETDHPPTLHLVCGKIASGKSTLTSRLAKIPGTVLISEDQWLHQLYPGKISSVQDYVRLTARLRLVMGPHIEGMLRAGVSVVLDFPANTITTRKWMRDIFSNAGCRHVLHYLEVSDEECKARLRLRNDGGAHQFSTSDAQFYEITQYFVAPSAEEGFFVVTEN